MRQLSRHIAVFCGGLGLAALVAYLVPLSVNPREIFLVFVILFFLYLGISLFLDFRGKKT